jgi:hypothetical protein
MPEETKDLRGDNSFRVEIVTTMEQLQHAYAIRAICFVEDGMPFDLAFDGNDLQATHVVAYVGEDPIGAQRIRWFAGFAKIERTAFRKEYRNARVLKRASEFVFAHIARKGYTVVVTHASPRYAILWQRVLGFKPVEGKAPAVFRGEEHVELVKHLTLPENAITLTTPPAVLFRTEGMWDSSAKYENTH